MTDKTLTRLIFMFAIVASGAAVYYAKRAASSEAACEYAAEKLEEASDELEAMGNLVTALTHELKLEAGLECTDELQEHPPALLPLRSLPSHARQEDGEDAQLFISAIQEGRES